MPLRTPAVPYAVVSLAAVLAAAAPALAAPPPVVTVYTRDLAFVREMRSLELRSASDTVRLADVPERIDFTSVRLAPSGARVARLAYRYDLANGEAALERARGGKVRVAMREDRVVEGTLVAVDGAWLMVRDDSGQLHTLARGSVDDVRASLPNSGWMTRPTIEAVLDGGKRGTIDAELSYLTGGMSWSAEHVIVRRGATGGTWSSAVTIDNQSGRDFVGAELKLVAGDPARDVAPPPMPYMMRTANAAADMEMKAQGADLSEQSFSEYHLYTLDRPATLRDKESQRLSMLDTRDVQVAPRYLYRGGDARGVRLQLVVPNRAAQGLGVAIPAGRVRVYEPDPDGDLQFVGESRVRHTAEGETLRVEVGSAFDITAERRELSSKRTGEREREMTVEIRLRNHKRESVTVVVEDGIGPDAEILKKSHDFVRRDAGTIEFSVPVAAGKETVISYTARVRY